VIRSSSRVLGLAKKTEGNETAWTLLSRGDRVRGRVIVPSGPGPHPVIVLASPAGSASTPLVEAAAAAWCARAALVVFDLPLFASRKSDKLTSLALDLRTPLAQRLRPELEAQVASDLAQVLALIESEPTLDAVRVTFAGVGLGADLARAFLAGEHGFAHVSLSPAEPPSASWLRDVGEQALRP
jgi:dienelactone hydrolase